MNLVLSLVILFGTCACRADDDEIELNEIGNGESVPREAERVHNATLAEIFENAVQAYLEEDWDDCVEGFSEALHRYIVIIIIAVLFPMNTRNQCTLIHVH